MGEGWRPAWRRPASRCWAGSSAPGWRATRASWPPSWSGSWCAPTNRWRRRPPHRPPPPGQFSLPTTPLEIGISYVYGLPLGLLASVFGKTAGSALAFLGCKAVGKRRGWRVPERLTQQLSKLDEGGHPLMSLILIRLAPIPLGMKNYGLALVPSCGFGYFTLASLIVNGAPALAGAAVVNGWADEHAMVPRSAVLCAVVPAGEPGAEPARRPRRSQEGARQIRTLRVLV